MSATFQQFAFRAKAILCLVLMLHVQFLVSGCGTNGGLLPAQQLRIPLSPDDPLNQALKDSPFAGATAIDVFPDQQGFSLVLPNKSQQLTGKYAYVDGQFTITQFFMMNRDQSATIDLTNGKQVNRIITGDGTTWKMPDASRDATAPQSPGLDAYLAANSSLLSVAKQIDAESASNGNISLGVNGPSSGTSAPKLSAGLSDPLRAVLLVFAGIWYPLFGILPGLITLFTVGAVLQNALVIRFDGDWAAANGGSKLMITISGGKVSRIIDPSSGQELTISNSVLQSVNGDHVVWSVDAGVLGQSTPVTFQFDVQELSNGSLQGTLTTLGSTFARVPVTLTRVS